MNKNDLRVIKTKNALYISLLDLMKEKAFEEIKVSDICNRALINRSTFYAHYEDKYDLFTDYIRGLKESLAVELKKNNNIATTKEYYMEMIRIFLNHIEEKRNSYLSIIINNRNSIIIDILYDAIDGDIISKLHNTKLSNQGVPTEVIARFYLGAVISTGISWIKNIDKYSKEEMINYFDKLIPDDK